MRHVRSSDDAVGCLVVSGIVGCKNVSLRYPGKGAQIKIDCVWLTGWNVALI